MSIAEALFSKTRIATWFAPCGLTGLIYQNQMKNGSSGPNAMVLTIPMKPTRENLETLERHTFDTTAFPKIAENLVETTPYAAKGLPMALMADERGADDFETRVFKCGALTYVAGDPRGVNARLAKLPAETRVQISDRYADSVRATGRADFTLVVVCFDGTELVEAPPLLFFFPQDVMPGQLVFPGLDDHTGDGPNLDEWVETDHALATSGDHLPADVVEMLAGLVRYENWAQMPEFVQNNVPRRVLTCTFDRLLPNGDWILDTRDPVFQTGMDGDRPAYSLMGRKIQRIGMIADGPIDCT